MCKYVNLCDAYDLTEPQIDSITNIVVLVIYRSQIKHAELTGLALLEVIDYGLWNGSG